MGVLPLMFKEGDSYAKFGLNGSETFFICGVKDMQPRKVVQVKAVREDESEISFETIARLDTEIEVDYFENGGVLPYVLRKLLGESRQ